MHDHAFGSRRSAFVLGAGCALALTVLGLVVRGWVPPLDRWLIKAIEIPPGSVLHQASLVTSTVGVLVCLAVLVAVAVRAWRQQLWRGAHVAWCAALLVLCASVAGLQYVFRRPGPPGQPDGFSYPSGHASIASALAVVAVIVAAVFVRSWLRAVVALQCTAVVLTMASRVALAEHYLSDVVGAVLGVAAVAFLAVAVSRTLGGRRPRAGSAAG